MAIVFPWVTHDESSVQSLRKHASAMTHISPTWLTMNAGGDIALKEQPEVTELARSNGLKLCPLVVNERFRADVADAILRDPVRRKANAQKLCSLVEEKGWDGLNLDFEGSLLRNRDHYTEFVALVSERLRPQGFELSLDVVGQTRAPRPIPADGDTSDAGTWADAYDFKALGALVDRFVIMGYDFHQASDPPGPVGPTWWLREILDWTRLHMDLSKVVLGLPFYGRRWTAQSLDRFPDSDALIHTQVASLLAEKGGRPIYDWDAQSWQYRYEANGAEKIVWFDDATSISARLKLIHEYGLAGAAFWRLGGEDERVWEAVRAIKNDPWPEGGARTPPSLIEQ